MNYKIRKALEKYARENNVRIVDWQQVGTRLFDLWVQTSGFFSETKWKRVSLNF